MRQPLLCAVMRIFYVVAAAAVLAPALLWLGHYNIIKKRRAAAAAALVLLAGGALLLLAVLPGNSFYGRVLTQGQEDAQRGGRKLVALTFDDGPYPPYTQQLLVMLAAKNVRATFFVVGENAAAQPQLLLAEQAGGHETELHAGYHRDFLKLEAGELAQNIAFGQDAIEKITGRRPRYIRPPHGFKDWQAARVISEAGLTMVSWSVIPRDWTNPGSEEIARRVCDNIHPGAIVLLHDGDSPAQRASREQTVTAAGIIIDRLRAAGYEFVTVSELLAARE